MTRQQWKSTRFKTLPTRPAVVQKTERVDAVVRLRELLEASDGLVARAAGDHVPPRSQIFLVGRQQLDLVARPAVASQF